MDKLKQAIFGSPVTTSIAMLCATALIVLAVWTKQLTVAQVINFLFTTAVGLSAKDGSKGGDQ